MLNQEPGHRAEEQRRVEPRADFSEKKKGDEMLEAVRAIRDALLSPRVRSLPGDESPFVLKCGELYDYSGNLCSRCMKRHVGGVFCFLTPHEDLMLDVFRLGVRTARIPEVEAEAKMRSG